MKVTWVILLIYVCQIYVRDREKEQAWSSRIIVTESLISTTVAILLCRLLSNAYADFVMCQIVITRILSTFYVHSQIVE